jgi:hypothetical protein
MKKVCGRELGISCCKVNENMQKHGLEQEFENWKF